MLGGARLSCLLACLLSGNDTAIGSACMYLHKQCCSNVDTGSCLLPMCVGLGSHTTVPLHLGLEKERKNNVVPAKGLKRQPPEGCI